MYRIAEADKDAYITNKIVGSTFRAKDANTGAAGTLDLFKLYDENDISNETLPIELSRILIHFDLTDLSSSYADGEFDVNSSNFKCQISLHDVYGGQTTPSNFSIISFPLAKEFDEGIGRSIIRFEDLDVCNYLTASVSLSTPVTWSQEGASKSGGIAAGSNNDIFASGSFGAGFINLFATQSFSSGEDDLLLDVTNVISGVLTNQIGDYGFRISFSGSQETDDRTRFVKRFASRNTINSSKRPKLIITYNDLIQDATPNFEFSTSGSIFLNSFSKGKQSNILSGSSLTELTGANCLKVLVKTGSIEKTFSGSQNSFGSVFTKGVYSSSFLISEFDTSLQSHITTSGSIPFDVYWKSNDLSVIFATTFFTASRPERTSFDQNPERFFINVTNMKIAYKQDEKVRFKLYIEDFNRAVVHRKTPLEKNSIILNELYYRVRDFENSDIIIPFDNPGTRISNDSTTHYFDTFMSSLPRGRTYTFDFKIISKGEEIIIRDTAAKFRIE